MDMMTTQGRFRDATIASAKDVFPEPELPATPMMLAFPHGGEYRMRSSDDMLAARCVDFPNFTNQNHLISSEE